MAVFDIETNGLKPTLIHCLSHTQEDGSITTYTKYDDMRSFFQDQDTLIGHNIVRYDIPVCERLLGIDIKDKKIVDTLPLSWYIYSTYEVHGLAKWGERLGVAKPVIDDWENLTIEEYINRCEEDVEINRRLWDQQLAYLQKLYNQPKEIDKLSGYLTFKMQCAQLQEASRWRLDVDRCIEGLSTLRQEKEVRTQQLKEVMPEVPTTSIRTKPKKMYLQDGQLTKLGVKWVELLQEHRLHPTYDGSVKVITGYKEPNPNSVPQLKDWLYSLGWVPDTFKYVRDKITNDIRKIEQINRRPPAEPGVSGSVRALFKKEPGLEALDGLSILTHRIGILNGFIRDVDEDGYIQAQVSGLTNTLRFKHKVAVNLPGVSKPYGDLIRGCLIAPYQHLLCGSDMSSLEDRTKQHYMWDYDPEYVKDMRSDDFDPHLDIAISAKIMTQDQVDAYRVDKSFKDLRHAGKTANYSCTYGASPQRLVYDSGLSLEVAQKLHKAYWSRNWALTAIAKDVVTKTVEGQMWLYNPVSKMWYSLRSDKDKFSTLNQGTGVYCFDTWIKHVLSIRKELTGQFHDEIILTIKDGTEDQCRNLLKWAIAQTNKELNLNVELGVDVEFGKNYAEIH
jgi:hypothetical protein